MSATITIITTDIEDPDQFEAMTLGERRQASFGWKVFPARSGRYPELVLVRATKIELGVFECEPEFDSDKNEKVHTYMIDARTIAERLPLLVGMVESNADATAHALVAKVGHGADLARVTDALKVGTWPEVNDVAAEAAAFAHHLLTYSRLAVDTEKGVCWEYRGDFPLGDQEIVAE